MWILNTGIRASLTGTGYKSGKDPIIAELIKLRRNLAQQSPLLAYINFCRDWWRRWVRL